MAGTQSKHGISGRVLSSNRTRDDEARGFAADYGLPEPLIQRLVGLLTRRNIPASELAQSLTEIGTLYEELLICVGSDDTLKSKELVQKAREELAGGRIDVAEQLLSQAAGTEILEAQRLRREAEERTRNAVLACGDCATMSEMQGDSGDAAEHWVRCAEYARNFANPPEEEIILYLRRSAEAYRRAQKFDDAERQYRQVLRYWRDSVGEVTPEMSATLLSLGELAHEKGDLPTAKNYYQSALDANTGLYGPQHSEVAITLFALGQLFKDMKLPQLAEESLQRCLVIWKKIAPSHPDAARCMIALAQVLQSEQREAETESLLRQAVSIVERTKGPHDVEVAATLELLAQHYARNRRAGSAEPVLRRALDIYGRTIGPGHPKIAAILAALAGFCEESARFDEAELLYQSALDTLTAIFGKEHPDRAEVLIKLANMLANSGRSDEAALAIDEALQILEATVGPEDQRMQAAIRFKQGLGGSSAT